MRDGIIQSYEMRADRAIIYIQTNNVVNEYYSQMSLSQFSRLEKDQPCQFDLKLRKGQYTKEINILNVEGENILLGVANAPFNFIPVDEKVVAAKKQAEGVLPATGEDGTRYDQIPAFDRYHQGLHTGYINLDIAAKTPIYIRDTYNRQEMKDYNEAQKQCKKCSKSGINPCSNCSYAPKRFNPEFYSPNGTPAIPGSSLRGMVRTLIEITSYSRMEFIDDTRFYYRRVADQSGRYQKLMLAGANDADHGLRPSTRAGWLKIDQGKYYVYPLQKPEIYRINARLIESKWRLNSTDDEGNTTHIDKPPFTFHEISFVPGPEAVHGHQNGRVQLTYALVTDFTLGHTKAESDGKYKKGYLILSGSMGNKHMHPIVHVPNLNLHDRTAIEDIVNIYREDGDREARTDLLAMLKSHSGGVPCFYLQDESGGIKYIGHTPLFRLAYEKTVNQHLPVKHRDAHLIDCAQAIFGSRDKFAGRLFFEDARSSKGIESYPALSPQILSGPKPTAVQHYLEQNQGRVKDWDDSSEVRGYKLYWHRKTPDRPGLPFSWQHKEQPVYDKQHTVIKAVKADSHPESHKTFSGRIRFMNLSDIEMGALLFVLDLPKGCAHKIGMGKSLGLGSVQITPTLVTSDRTSDKGRYSKLFAGRNWHLAEEQIVDTKQLKDAFVNYIFDELGDKPTNTANPQDDFWKEPRMKELRIMLDFDVTDYDKWNVDTAYMRIDPAKRINDFKNRWVLPNPTKVTAKARKSSKRVND